MVTREIKDVMDSIVPDDSWMHAYSYSGYPTCCAVALKDIEILQREGLRENARNMGSVLHARLIAAFGAHANARDIRGGKELLAAVEFVEDPARKRTLPRIAGSLRGFRRSSKKREC